MTLVICPCKAQRSGNASSLDFGTCNVVTTDGSIFCSVSIDAQALPAPSKKMSAIVTAATTVVVVRKKSDKDNADRALLG